MRISGKSGTALVVLFLLVFPQLGFWHRKSRPEPPPNPKWVEAENEQALTAFKETVQSRPHQNYLFVPFQSKRLQILRQASQEPSVLAQEAETLNYLKRLILQNSKHQMEIVFEELLLENKHQKKNPIQRQLAKNMKVKVRRADYERSGKLSKIQKSFSKKMKKRLSVSLTSLSKESGSQPVSGFYLSGRWRKGFSSNSSQPQKFETAAGFKPVSMMSQKAYLDSLNEELFKAFDLRYGDGKVGLLIFVPKESVSLSSFYESLNPESWKQWQASFLEREAEIELPSFDLQDFSQPFMPVRFRVAEAGGGEGLRYEMKDILGPAETFKVSVLRPFFLAVVDYETDLILMLGQVTDPVSNLLLE